MLKIQILFFLICFSFSAFSQEKKKIDHTDYDLWKSIHEEQLSVYGKVITYETTSLRGDGTLFVHQPQVNKLRSFRKGKKAKIAFDETYVVFKISPGYDTIRSLKIDKIPKKKWPVDSLGVYLIQKDTLLMFPDVTSFNSPEKGSEWLGILHDKKFTLPENTKEKKKKKCKLRKKKEESLPKENGKVLRMYQPSTQNEKIIKSVTEYKPNATGTIWCWIQSKTYNDSIDSSYVSVFDAASQKSEVIWKGLGEAAKLTLDEKGEQLAFLWSVDTSKVKTYALCFWDAKSNATTVIVDTVASIFPTEYSVSNYKTPYFSKNGKRLFFGVAKKPEKVVKDTIPDDEKAKLDVWSWTDGRIQPQQLKELDKDRKDTDLYLYHVEEKKFLQITDSLLQRVSIPFENNGDFALGTTQIPYYKEMTWDTWYYDYFRIDLSSGKREPLIRHHSGSVSLSPSGNYFAYYLESDSCWYVKDLQKNTVTNLTRHTDGKFYRKYHDVPSLPDASGGVNWLLNEQNVLIKDQNDYWVFSLQGGKPYKLTNGTPNHVEYNYIKLNKDEEYIDLTQPLYFKFVNEKTRNEGIATYGVNGMESVLDEPFQLIKFVKADSSEKVMFRQMSAVQYPEIQYSDVRFSKRKTLSSTNPQQENYNWTTVEIFSWESDNGDTLSGLLYKPEDFDSTRQYPLMVYFYERYTQDFHRYYAPKPTASIVFPTEYASNGYLVFIPDISYEVGHPAQSAYAAIVGGTDALLAEYSCIDSTRMALQGQSWGGYQTAQLITMTNKYKCAMAGAPVSNMFSAYGGIRWGSGHNRAFQYEKGQSRIGKTIWEAPELYIENSPIFHLPNVKTPLLIMHNDGDGAVPWYQGIELFTGLRRLNQPVWMLNYNGDEHNLMKIPNRRDLSIKMREFFDYYLLDKPMPEWMKFGVPALENEKNKQLNR